MIITDTKTASFVRQLANQSVSKETMFELSIEIYKVFIKPFIQNIITQKRKHTAKSEQDQVNCWKSCNLNVSRKQGGQMSLKENIVMTRHHHPNTIPVQKQSSCIHSRTHSISLCPQKWFTRKERKNSLSEGFLLHPEDTCSSLLHPILRVLF